MTTLQRPLVIALAYDGLCTFEFGVAVEIFGLPRPELGDNWYRFAVAAVEPGALQATGGIHVVADGGLELLPNADMIIIPGWRGIDAKVPEMLCQSLREAHQRGTRLVSICSGVFVLAAAGLLHQRKATTHWRYTEQLQHRYPSISVSDNVLYQDEGQVMTSAGSAAGIDLCLHIVRKDFGHEIANNVARRLVIQPHRQGDQPQNLTRPMASPRESQTLGALFDFLQQNLAQTHTVSSLAERVNMSPRTFLRRFEALTGMTPARWLLNERLIRVQDYLQNSVFNIEKIAELTGFGNSALLRHHFHQRFLLSPSQYLKNSRSPSQ
ncbi:transcriptional regulator FtrA [Escherichia coli]